MDASSLYLNEVTDRLTNQMYKGRHYLLSYPSQLWSHDQADPSDLCQLVGGNKVKLSLSVSVFT